MIEFELQEYAEKSFSCIIDLLNDFYIRCKVKTYKDRTTVGIPLCLM